MINFKRVFLKNFASYGGAGAEIILNNHQLTAIVGENASGKTTMLSAICFALYGKTFNGTQKSKIINSINGKHLLVELDFETNNVDYRIRRGMKPNIFEIYKNGKLITQESATKNYQDILEREIIKVNIKNFMQTVLIGTASFTPFMELSALDRRQVVENILGVEVLTDMSSLLKNKLLLCSQELTQVSNVLNTIKLRLKNEQNQIRLLENIHKTDKEKNDSIIASNEIEIQKCLDDIKVCEEQLKKFAPLETKYEELKEFREKVQEELTSIVALMKSNMKSLKFLSTHDSCPMCLQTIGAQYKSDLSGKLTVENENYQTKVDNLKSDVAKKQEMEDKLLQVFEKKHEINQRISSMNAKISSYNRENKRLLQESAETDKFEQIELHKQEIIRLAEEAEKKLTKKKKLTNLYELMSFAEKILRDSGIKSSVIEKFLPIINHKINEYLSKTDLYIHFEFDSAFNEMILARERDEFGYNNLSQGERMRLNMSILLTWRYITTLINSTNCNLLIIDELLDSALDANGVDAVLGMLRDLKGYNIFIISHKAEIQDSRFDHYLKVKKVNQFSVIE